MKTEQNILIAFILNLSFAVVELLGGIIIGSVAIASDAVHDAGDAISIGASYFLEKKSKKQPDDTYTYGYGRYSVLGGLIINLVLVFSSIVVTYNAIIRIINPISINHNEMIFFGLAGVLINFITAFFTRQKSSINQKAVNLHMVEDVLGWLVVLIGAVIIKFTGFILLDPIMSISVASFILINALKNLKEILGIFLEKVPKIICISELKAHIEQIDGIIDVHHIHLFSIDGYTHNATMHIVTDVTPCIIKKKVREKMKELGINHTTIETETSCEECHNIQCRVNYCGNAKHIHVHDD